MKLGLPIFLLLGATALIAPGRGEDMDSGLSCTAKSLDGKIYIVSLRVPKGEGGPCELVGVSRVSIAEPSLRWSPGPGVVPWGAVETHSYYTTNFASGKPVPPGTLELSWMALQVLAPLTTTQGTTYTDCRLLTFQQDGIIVVRDEGVFKILVSDLDAVSRQRVESMR